MLNAKCPNCSKELMIQKRKVDTDLVKVVIICRSCGYYQELLARTKDEKTAESFEQKKDDKIIVSPLREIPPSASKPIQIIMEKARESNYLELLPIYYGNLYNEPPELGVEVSPESLYTLGLKNTAVEISKSLLARGIERLYKFQEEAIKSIRSGNNVIITAPTAMGKTEAFLLPALDIAYETGECPSVLMIYPTKALARDQLEKILYYSRPLGLRVSVLDGDTPAQERLKITKDPPHILITNFDMIHYWLPKISKNNAIPKLFLSAKLVILDEVHVYSGAFGSHVHYIIKRMRRLAKSSQRKLQIVLASATIYNPADLARKLIDDEVKVVIGSGRKVSLDVLFLYTQLPTFHANAKILAELIRHGTKTLVFCNTRSCAELTYNFIKRSKLYEVFQRVNIHRAGISAQVRRKIERDFKSGKLLGIISTPTLELGIDIGNVSAVVTEIAPSDRFIQRSGRAGRRKESGAAILLLRSDDPISEYYATNPEEYFRDISSRYLEPRNPLIAKQHIYIMAYEKPLSEADIHEFNLPREVIAELESERALLKVGDHWVANGVLFYKYFSRNIRGVDIQVDVYCNNRRIDRRDIVTAVKELHPGAIHIVQGNKYLVRSLDLTKLRAEVEPAPPEYERIYTKPLYSYSAVPIGSITKREACGTIIHHGLLEMKISVWGYNLYEEGQKEPIAHMLLEDVISYKYVTYGLFFLAPEYSEEKDEEAITGAYHAVEHILIEGTYMISGGSEYDLGGVSFGKSGLIVVYESLPGGNGITSLLFDRFEEAVKKAYKILSTPSCMAKESFNKCVFSYHCGNNNKPLNQRGAREILRKMLSGERVPNADKAVDLLKVFEEGIV
ncbi:MAG: DEAD/DEAH box helicase [Candidatus Korarchaeota archaeon]|nr:DEAD/DEAH box helicase [Thermoproteota archaeon]MCR8462797.1 DEAD/DEAH box helicase [Thermoproteota archaeon]MCR8470508.1 DEAD/DEAH box helicase [Thermoproteota archaeon]MCR8471503.1 DEAD/DEAH box helicase [Thermoproteota archaeon]MCR8472843.1 DEAD/DEAH box helicase [Thermoproteota archaeon]